MSRNNAGVHSVSCLVFDCDRVPPDPERLAGGCWIGHTTYQHTPEKPRWRVVIPLARPVAAKRWREVWQRARAAVTAEAEHLLGPAALRRLLVMLRRVAEHSGGLEMLASRRIRPSR